MVPAKWRHWANSGSEIIRRQTRATLPELDPGYVTDDEEPGTGYETDSEDPHWPEAHPSTSTSLLPGGRAVPDVRPGCLV